MDHQEQIINRVSRSPLVTIDLETLYHPGERVVYDLKDNLYQELILREKDFRDFIGNNDWSVYKNKNVALICSTEAIVPTWAYMLLTSRLGHYAHKVVLGDLKTLEDVLFRDALSTIDVNQYADAKVVIKGCSKLPVPESAYVEITRLLLPIASSIMYGEPCSTVPIFKKTKIK
jgi:hypothetical protein